MSNGAGGVSATVSAGQQTVVTVGFGTPGFCMLPQRIVFQTAGSWVAPLPGHLAAYSAVLDRLARSAAARLLVVGHTDDQGPDTLNDPLSERRARAVLAVLTGNTAEWEAIYRAERVDGENTPWGRAAFVTMLQAAGQPTTQANLNEHRDLAAAGQARRATLFAAYFRVLLSNPAAAPVVRSTTPGLLGCGEHHVLAPGEHAPSRRAEFVFFSGSGAPALACPGYPGWANPCAPIPLPPSVPPANVAFHVSTAGSDATGDGSLGAPWRTFAHSFTQIAILRQGGQHVTLKVLGGTFDEPVIVPSGTTVEGVGDPPPRIRGSAGEPVVLMREGRDKHVFNLLLTGGGRSGVRIEETRDASVRACTILENTAPRGGGVAIVNSTNVTVAQCTIARNSAGNIDSAVTHAHLEVILHPVVICGDVSWGRIQEFEFTPGDSHGGGVYVQNSSFVGIQGNTIRNNRAILFGGGVAVDNSQGFTGAVEIQGNEILCNQVAHGPLGGLEDATGECADDVGDPVVEHVASKVFGVGDRAAGLVVPLLHGVGVESGMGGGVALRHVSPATRLTYNVIGQEGNPNRARRGGGVACFTGAYPRLEGNEIAFNLASDDGGGITIDEFDPFLPAEQPAFMGFARGVMVSRQTIRMVANTLHGNACREDGGGMYVTGGVRLEVSEGTVSGNRAGQNGGGIRISYAVRLTVTDTTFSENQSKALGGDEKDGGGALAARNAEFHLVRCTFTDNVANAFAGGAVFCNSTFEGGFNDRGFQKNVPAQFDRLMEQEHGFTRRLYRFTDCSGAGNRATGPRGAGGFIYAVRAPGEECGSPLGGEQPLHVVVDGAATAIGVNTSEYDNPDPVVLRRKRANVTIELSGRDDATGRPQDRVLVTGLAPVPAGVALSTPSPDEKAVAVLHDRTQARPDDRPTTFPYQNVGPRVTGVVPAFGDEEGGDTVVVGGDDFLPGARVFFGGVEAVGPVIRLPSGELQATTPPLQPPRVAGPVDVEVRNPDDAPATPRRSTLADGFEYTTLTLAPGSPVAPPVGAVDRATPVVIRGTGFLPTARVFIGSQECLDKTWVDRTELRVLAPPSPTGQPETADVAVVLPNGRHVRRTNGFRWDHRPRLTGVHPRGRPAAGGTPVTLTGLRLTAGTQVRFGGRPGTVLSSSPPTSLVVAVPPADPSAPALVAVRVTNPDDLFDEVPAAFRYAPAPEVLGLAPDHGSSTTSAVVTVGGAHFQATPSVLFGTASSPHVTFLSATTLQAEVPPPTAGPGAVDVTVANPDGQTGTRAGAFTYT